MSEHPHRASRRSQILRATGTLIALVALIYLLGRQGWDEIWAAIEQIPTWRILLALSLMLVSRLAVSARWHALLRSSGEAVSFWKTTRITFAGLFASNFLPTTIGGDVIRLAGAIQLEIDAALSAASLIVDRLVGMAGMAMAAPLGLLAFPAGQPLSIGRHAPLVALSAGEWPGKIGEKIRDGLRRVLQALSIWARRPRSLILSLAFSWLNMLCLFGVLYQLLAGMGDGISFWLIGGLYSLTYFVTLLPVSINGYGLQEVAMVFFFSNLGGASVNSSLTAALLFRTMMMLASLPGAAFVPGMLAYSRQRQTTSSAAKPTTGPDKPSE